MANPADELAALRENLRRARGSRPLTRLQRRAAVSRQPSVSQSAVPAGEGQLLTSGPGLRSCSEQGTIPEGELETLREQIRRIGASSQRATIRFGWGAWLLPLALL